MKIRYSILLIISLFCSNIFAQNYFQQEVNYTINVSLDDKKNELFANETIQYINNSPDTLKFICLHLWPNAYKNYKTALCAQMLMSGNDILANDYYTKGGYIDSLDFKVDNKEAEWDYFKDFIDICYIYLDKPMLSGDTIFISTPFHVKIPSNEISRMGHGTESYQISQWYPKPAVYDANGWNIMPYLDYGEYYSEFGSFDVSITEVSEL